MKTYQPIHPFFEDDCTQVDEVRPDLESATEKKGRSIALAVLLFIAAALILTIWVYVPEGCRESAECVGRLGGTIR